MRSRANAPSILLTMAALAVSLACATIPVTGGSGLQVDMQVYPLPDGMYRSGPVWVEESLMVLNYRDVKYGDIPNRYWKFWLMDSDGTNLRPFDLPPAREDCFGIELSRPHRLPDGRLGYQESCVSEVTGTGPKGLAYDLDTRVLAYDWESGEIENLFDYPITTSGIDIDAGSWNTDMTMAVASDAIGFRLSERLAWFGHHEMEYVDINFPVSFLASWSPDGQKIVFSGDERQPTPGTGSYDLYIMDATPSHNPRLLLSDSGGGTIWSPDSQWIIIGGEIQDREGLWLVNVKSRQTYLLAKGGINRPSWSPDMTRIAAIREPDPFEDRQGKWIVEGYELLIIDMESIWAQLENSE